MYRSLSDTSRSPAGMHPLNWFSSRPSCPQVGEAAQLCRYLPAQLVEGEPQQFQVGQVTQLCRHLTAQLVPVEAQPFQVGEVAQLRRYLPAQLVEAEVQPGNPARAVGPHTMPFVERPVAEPVVVVGPIGAIGGIVESYQSGKVSLTRGGHRRGECPPARDHANRGAAVVPPGREGYFRARPATIAGVGHRRRYS